MAGPTVTTLPPAAEAPVTAAAFRDGMAALACAVSIVTTDGARGAHGFTASAVCSVSDAPPTLLVCINRATSAHPHVLDHGVMAVNVLHRGQAALSDAFASRSRPMAERFAAATWRRGRTGAPLLDGALVSFDCRVSEVRDVATHTIVIARVIDMVVRHDGARPGLIWFNRAYGHPVTS
ncbi:flavin reductase [Novacetimonas cocois]|uniref:Flavin reductase n=1 Tax=Novacetimonas cocois TaxID=1747507 RepID=A0A365YX98_9PROT|nr:flavin reductase [Novacetimonas cocois]RBM07738.1 flavin reductase [Novacetimonas cocois]